MRLWEYPEKETRKQKKNGGEIHFLYIDCVHRIARRKRCMRAFFIFSYSCQQAGLRTKQQLGRKKSR